MQRAQRSFLESLLAVLTFLEKKKRNPAFPPGFRIYAFGHFYLCVLCDLCGSVFYLVICGLRYFYTLTPGEKGAKLLNKNEE